MYDMILAGGGPAGAVAAERAAQKGLSVLVLEKETYPRDNARGCVVSQKSLDAIRGDRYEIDRGGGLQWKNLPAGLPELYRQVK